MSTSSVADYGSEPYFGHLFTHTLDGGMVTSTKPRSGESSPLDAAVSNVMEFCEAKFLRYKIGKTPILYPHADVHVRPLLKPSKR